VDQDKVHRIFVTARGEDTRAAVRKAHIEREFPQLKLRAVWLVSVYTICKRFGAQELERIRFMLTNQVIEESSLDDPLLPPRFSWSFEIGFLPGVTDNVGHTAAEAICDLLGVRFEQEEGVFSSEVTFLDGDLTEEEARRIAEIFSNPLIHRVEVLPLEAHKQGRREIYVPLVKLPPPAEVLEVDLEVPDEELIRLGREGIPDPRGGRRGPLALDLDSLHAIREHFRALGRKPTDVELESIAQTWSEHCKHTIFAAGLDEIQRGLYRTYIQGATEKVRRAKGDRDFCVSVFKDNSGVIAFDEQWLVTDKVETHNSPCALDPFGGAVTGIVGVNRDAIGCGLGAKPVINRFGFCFSYPDDDRKFFRDPERRDPLLPARRVIEGVIEGVNVGGNCSGIPTPQGFLYFDRRYRGKPLVFVGTVGLLPRVSAGRPAHEKQARPGDIIVMVGGRVGRDGIHGATFSSEALSAGSPASAVQIGDPITQKKLSDALVKEARDLGLYNSITDNGAGGLSCSVAEMAREAGGCFVELDKVPLKYPGLEPWQIWVSESQERMTLAVPAEKLKALLDLMARRGVEATPIGRFEASGKCRVSWHGRLVMDLDLRFLHEGLPCKLLRSQKPPPPEPDDPPSLPENWGAAVLGVLARPNVASFSFVSFQYDHEVQGGSVLKPVTGPGRINVKATVVRPVLDRMRGVALSQALFPAYGDLDPYAMAACAVDAAVRQVVAVGADPDHIALLDNTCWCSSYEPVRLWQLKEAIRACHDYAVDLQAPFISGKDSMFNDFNGYDAEGNPVKISVPPTILISSLAVVPDVRNCVSPDVKQPGDKLYIVGSTDSALGGSEFLAWCGETQRGRPYRGSKAPLPSLGLLERYRRFGRALSRGLIASAEAVGLGGLAIAASRKALGGMLGLRVDLGAVPQEGNPSVAELLFAETPGRILCTVRPEHAQEFEELMGPEPCSCIGEVTRAGLQIQYEGRTLAELSLEDLSEAYHGTFRGFESAPE